MKDVIVIKIGMYNFYELLVGVYEMDWYFVIVDFI